MLYVYCCLFLSYKMSVFNLTEKKRTKKKQQKQTSKHEGNKEQKKKHCRKTKVQIEMTPRVICFVKLLNRK